MKQLQPIRDEGSEFTVISEYFHWRRLLRIMSLLHWFFRCTNGIWQMLSNCYYGDILKIAGPINVWACMNVRTCVHLKHRHGQNKLLIKCKILLRKTKRKMKIAMKTRHACSKKKCTDIYKRLQPRDEELWIHMYHLQPKHKHSTPALAPAPAPIICVYKCICIA